MSSDLEIGGVEVGRVNAPTLRCALMICCMLKMMRHSLHLLIDLPDDMAN